MNRSEWKQSLTHDSSWPWACPACETGRLRLHKPSLVLRETRNSRTYRASKDDDGWEPDLCVARFTALLVCDHPLCEEPVFVCGTTSDEPETGADGEADWKQYLIPAFFHPALQIISIPKDCPKAVRQEIEKAFALYWCDLLCCANRVRNAVEHLLTHLKIIRFRIDGQKKKKKRVWLHERIRLFSQRGQAERDLATAMFAVKWIGNEGSHPGKLTNDDLLDAFQLLEHVLSVLFVPPEQSKVAELAKAIHKRKKPRSHQIYRKRRSAPSAPCPPPSAKT